MIQQQNKYLQTSVQTATPAQLLIMLYDGAIRFCKKAIDSIQKKDYQSAHNNLSRAQDIIYEFMETLDHSLPLSKNLMQLYEYFLHRLVEANIQKNEQAAAEVLQYLIELKETWVQASHAQPEPGTSLRHG